ncbi:hypothetical protein OV079_49760 [Nannocystis pusilla]|uniref:Uncharacterized protein n=1 Tax=Nannocystis pusilla TaxID=889268 RepID=A0A9X3F0H9_9BACT|nr:hypothetical protein [Nannocystis pusilla]MCY1013486.1 hypothetical protein [Nannocystis pusilla]
MSAEELPEELRQAGDSPLDLGLAVDRGLRWWPQLCAEPRLRALTLRCDLGGNEEEFAALAEAIAAVGLPPRLQRLVLDRRRHWSDRWDDVLELDEEEAALELAIDEPGDAAPILAALQVMLTRAPGLQRIALASNARGRNDLDPALERVIAAGPWPQLRSLALTCDRSHERDWVQWVATRTMARVLAQCPGLTALSLPRAELWLEALEHVTLRELEIGWLGGRRSVRAIGASGARDRRRAGRGSSSCARPGCPRSSDWRSIFSTTGTWAGSRPTSRRCAPRAGCRA